MEDHDVLDNKPNPVHNINFQGSTSSLNTTIDTSKTTIITEPVDISFATSNIDLLSKAQEDTRAKIAVTFTQSFLVIIGVCLFLPFLLKAVSINIFPNPMETAKDLITTTASILSGPFGFIVGFYFKQSTNKNG